MKKGGSCVVLLLAAMSCEQAAEKKLHVHIPAIYYGCKLHQVHISLTRSVRKTIEAWHVHLA